MRTLTFLPGILLPAIALFFSAGCTKNLDYGSSDCRDCNIKNITWYQEYNGKLEDSIHYSFSYNILGNPVSIINDHVNTGNSLYYFFYDSHGRLSELIKSYSNGLYGTGPYDVWDRYGYNSKNEIILDTVYGFGSIIGGKPQPSDRYGYISYTYDTKRRISHEHGDFYIVGHYAYTLDYDYNYDAAGNLITGAVYDNKLNLYRTNSVWMFLARDYSVNNPFTATQYNDHYLPLRFSTNSFRLIPWAGAMNSYLKVEYWCR